MILLELRDYLRQRGQASLQELVQHFSSDPDSVRAMLAQLIRKGKVHSNSAQPALPNRCGNCTHCDSTAFEIYYYGDGQNKRHFPCIVTIRATTQRSENNIEV